MNVERLCLVTFLIVRRLWYVLHIQGCCTYECTWGYWC